MPLIETACIATNVFVTSCGSTLHKGNSTSTFCKEFLQLATEKFVALLVVQWEVIRAQRDALAFNDTILHHRLQDGVARITGLLGLSIRLRKMQLFYAYPSPQVLFVYILQ